MLSFTSSCSPALPELIVGSEQDGPRVRERGQRD